MHSIILLSLLPALAVGQSLVLVGGALTVENKAVWDRLIELGVSIRQTSHLLFLFNIP